LKEYRAEKRAEWSVRLAESARWMITRGSIAVPPREPVPGDCATSVAVATAMSMMAIESRWMYSIAVG
jgi:hypothetical protein